MRKRLSQAMPLMFLMYLLSGIATVHAEEKYLFELLEDPKYLQTWDALIASQQNVDSWLANYPTTKNGPAAPGTIVHLDGDRYQLNFVCKAHDCGDNHFVVLFAEEGGQAWGILHRAGKDTIYFGAPDAEKIKAMEAEVGR
jgi:hypothetical protein